MIEAWLSSSEMTASSSPSSTSNTPPFASKHEGNRIVASVPEERGEPVLELDVLGSACRR